MVLAGKHIVLTGAASGIGRALLDQLATYPVQILAVDLNDAALQAAVNAQTGKAATVYAAAANLMLHENVDVIIDDAIERMGSIDIFIANAGFAYYEQLGSADWQHIEKIFQLNTFSPIYTALRMRELNENRPYQMVMMASAMAHLNLPGYALYGATKASLDRFAESYRFELPAHGKLMLVYPIATRTQFFKSANAGTPVPWPSQTPETVAQAVIRGIERGQNSVYPSSLFRLGWEISQVLPWGARLYQMWQNREFRQWLREKRQKE